MRNRTCAFLAVIFVISCIIVAGCVQPGGQDTAVTAPTPLPVPQKGANVTMKEIIPYVNAAAAFAHEQGKEPALAVFNDPNSSFNQGALYIFSEGMDGTALAEPFEHEIVGTSILNFTDPYGIPLVKNLIDTARQGKGLVSYQYRNPSRNYSVESKVSYVVNIDGTYYVGAGYYEHPGTVFPAAGLKKDPRNFTAEELVSFVEGAAAFARTNGREQAVQVFMNTSGPFVTHLAEIVHTTGSKIFLHLFKICFFSDSKPKLNRNFFCSCSALQYTT
ncbi:MAG: hypothetical protein STSR0009_27040 [Methanoregula sp.]